MDAEARVGDPELYPAREELGRGKWAGESADVGAVGLRVTQSGTRTSGKLDEAGLTCMSDMPALRPMATLPCRVFQQVS